MRRLIFAIMTIALCALFLAPGTAWAAVVDTTYPAPAPLVLTVVDPVIHVGDSTTVLGTGATPGEQITFSRPGFPDVVVPADANGSFQVTLQFPVVGRIQVVATARSSGQSSSVTVTVLPATAPAAAATATTTLAPRTVDGGLASTGAGIAGPLVVGAALLVAGSAALLTGARLVSRGRRQVPRH